MTMVDFDFHHCNETEISRLCFTDLKNFTLIVLNPTKLEMIRDIMTRLYLTRLMKNPFIYSDSLYTVSKVVYFFNSLFISLFMLYCQDALIQKHLRWQSSAFGLSLAIIGRLNDATRLPDRSPTSSYMNWSVSADLPTPPLPTIITLWRAREFGALGLLAVIFQKNEPMEVVRRRGLLSLLSLAKEIWGKKEKHQFTSALGRSQPLQCIVGTPWRAAPDVSGTKQ